MSIVESALTDRPATNTASEDVYDDGFLRVEHKHYYVACGGQAINLPRAEFLLLARLVQSVDRIVTADDLWRCAWEDGKPFNAESLHVHIYRLRHKLAPYKIRIETMVNVGYRLALPNDNT